MNGSAVGAAAAAIATEVRSSLPPHMAWSHLCRAAAERYRAGGRFALHFARGKLGRDPVFRALLERAAIPPGARVLDVGCGQALLASLLAQCEAMAAAGQWPLAWGAAPVGIRYTGLDLMPRDIARGERALAALAVQPRLVCGDLRNVTFAPCEVAVVLDVLHYLEPGAQREVLLRIRRALEPGGRLLLRVGDAGQRVRFGLSQWIDRLVALVRTHRASWTWGQSLAQWQEILRQLGFRVEVVPMSVGTPFANVLLVCDLGAAAR